MTCRVALSLLITAVCLGGERSPVRATEAVEAIQRIEALGGVIDRDAATGQLSLVAEGFADFESLAMDYCRATRSRPYETSCSDGERMLDWLRDTQSLDDRQREHGVARSPIGPLFAKAL